MNRLAILLSLAMFGAATIPTGVAGCGSGPYTGKPERLKKPRAKNRPPDKPPAAETAEADGAGKPGDKPGDKGEGKDGKGAPVSDEQCRTNFFAEPKKKPRRAKDARTMTSQADTRLQDAEGQDGAARQQLVVEAIGTLSNALDKDPYGPEPTYKLAVAYALVGRKSCSLALLERLKALGGMPEVENEASRTIQRASRDPAFGQFNKEARAALGL